jgi:hypothetical protein
MFQPETRQGSETGISSEWLTDEIEMRSVIERVLFLSMVPLF